MLGYFLRMHAVLLLVLMPGLFSVTIAYAAVLLMRRIALLVRINRFLYFFVQSCVLVFFLALGSILGLLFSLQINRIIFGYRALTEALPSGVYLWYGFGPGLTPQFASYWRFVILVNVITFLVLSYKGWERRQFK